MPAAAVRTALFPGHARPSGSTVCGQSAHWYAFLRLLPTANLAHNLVRMCRLRNRCRLARLPATRLAGERDAPVADRSPRRPSLLGAVDVLDARASGAWFPEAYHRTMKAQSVVATGRCALSRRGPGTHGSGGRIQSDTSSAASSRRTRPAARPRACRGQLGRGAGRRRPRWFWLCHSVAG